MHLNALQDNKGARKSRTRVGRGIGSGKGKTCGRGHKGQKSRSGVSGIKLGFEGGQTPIMQRLPKFGFNRRRFMKSYFELNTGAVQKLLDSKKMDAGKIISLASLKEAGVFKGVKDGLRILAKGELKTAVKIEAVGASKKAIEDVKKAGGEIVIKLKEVAPVKNGKAKKTSAKS